jgi:hypothetical protein
MGSNSSPKGWPRDQVGRAVSEAWQRERVQRLVRIFRCLDRGRQRGKRLRKMLMLHAWRSRGRYYKADPARPIRFSYSTLLRLFYQWRQGGRTTAALALRYHGNRKTSLPQVVELAKLCQAPETLSFSAAYRKLARPGATECAFRLAIPPHLKVSLATLFAHRRHGRVLERTTRQITEEVAEFV